MYIHYRLLCVCGHQRQQESRDQRLSYVQMVLVNNRDHLCEVENRRAALNTILTPLVDNGTFSEKQRQATIQQYTNELQELLKRITSGL